MQQKIKILYDVFLKILKYILFLYFLFLYKEFSALENLNPLFTLNKKIKYKSDIIKYDLYNKKYYLIGNSVITYNKLYIKANFIKINLKKNIIAAYSKYNKLLSNYIINNKILIIYNNKKYYCNNFVFNLKTQIGRANNLIYQEKSGIIISKSIKKKKICL